MDGFVEWTAVFLYFLSLPETFQLNKQMLMSRQKHNLAELSLWVDEGIKADNSEKQFYNPNVDGLAVFLNKLKSSYTSGDMNRRVQTLQVLHTQLDLYNQFSLHHCSALVVTLCLK